MKILVPGGMLWSYGFYPSSLKNIWNPHRKRKKEKKKKEKEKKSEKKKSMKTLFTIEKTKPPFHLATVKSYEAAVSIPSM